ncbi:MAG: hypothetical protein NC122_07080 [Faecalibacterium sp.]|nr:hypothetical protein [Ruminococcus sp.]MCM1392258.1 hypothetical protein [Ruminococcus sp.]MCM1485954.1 hypothetical protein [Faecalibacterium sp.]
MTVDGYLNFNTKIDTKGFNGGTKSITSGLGGMKSMLGKVGLAVSAAFSVKQLVSFGKQSIEIASDLQEVQNVVDTAFGDMSYKMEQFADKAIETFGISRLSAKQTGSTFMAMAKGMDIADESASDMAVALTGLSADMASFYNVEQDVASTALKSVFTGETETLKRFGIVMTEANLEAFALSKGITKAYSDMSQAEKVSLRYAYVMKQTALAQGDFAKTSDSWANQTRMLSEKWKEFSGVIGSALIQTVLPAVRLLNQAMSQLIEFANSAFKALSEVFGWQTEEAKNTGNAISESVDNQKDLTEETKKTGKANKDNLQSFDKINKLQGDSSDDKDISDKLLGLADASAYKLSVDADTSKAESQFDKFVSKLKNKLNGFKKWYDKNFSSIFTGTFHGLENEFSELTVTFEKIFSDIKTLAEPLKDYFNNDFTRFLQTFIGTCGNILIGLFDTFNMVFADIWNVAVFPIINNFIESALPMLTQFATEVIKTFGALFDSIKEIFDTFWTEGIKPVIELLVHIWEDCVDSLYTAWQNWGAPIFEQIRKALTKTKELFLELWEKFLKPLVDKVIEVAKDIWDNHLKPLVDNILDFIGELIDGALRIYNQFIQPVLSWFIDKFGPPLSAFFQGIVEMVGKSISGIIDFVNGIVTTLKGIIQFVVGVFTLDWEKAWTGIKNIFGGIFDALIALAKQPINGIIGFINQMINAVCSGINILIRAINSISVDLPEWAGGYHIGFNFAEIVPPQIPYLATGTVVPANYGEFLAVLGDNRREPEIVSPRSEIKKAMEEVMSARGDSNQPIEVYCILDGDVVYRNVVKHNKQAKKSMGVNPLVV